MSIYHTCLKKYINFFVFWCILEFAKNKTNAVRPPSFNYVYFFQILSQKEIQLWIKTHLALRVSTRMQNKMYIHADWSASLYTALVSNVMRTCKGTSVQVDQRVYFCYIPHPQKAASGKVGQWMF